MGGFSGVKRSDEVTADFEVLTDVAMATIFRPHRRTTYVDAAYCYRPSSVVQ